MSLNCRDRDTSMVLNGGIHEIFQIFPNFPCAGITGPSLATVGVTAQLFGAFLGHLGHFLRLGAAQGGSDCLHKSLLHSS